MITSRNPATEDVLAAFPEAADDEIDAALERAHRTAAGWKDAPLGDRCALLISLANQLEAKEAELARTMALEMGKPVSEGRAEIQKCAWVCRYYAQEAEGFLADHRRTSDGSLAFVRIEPLGPLLAVMPWNFPFWQVFRCLAPAMALGNVVVLKHASNVPQCALAIAELFRRVDAPAGLFENLLIASGPVAEKIIADPRIRAVTLTGSKKAGIRIAELAGRHLKKCVLELGGSDPFIVLEDAHLAETAKGAALARCLNTGQSCIAAKRFIVHESLEPRFSEVLAAEMAARVMGDPLDACSMMGPLARDDIRRGLSLQVEQSVKNGAELICGGKIPGKKGYWYPATVLRRTAPGHAVFDEEVFGPVAAVASFRTDQEAVALANRSEYGLGASIWTGNADHAERLLPQIESGSVFINGIVKSDPRLPFGGVKHSGHGRELGPEGLYEFANLKTVWRR